MRCSSLRALIFVMAVGHLSESSGQELKLEAPVDGGIYKHPVKIEVETWMLERGASVFLDDRLLTEDTVVREEGEYQLELQFSDSTEVESIRFVIDRTAPRIHFVRPEGLPKGALPRVRVEDANPSDKRATLLLDGEPYDRSAPLEPGEHLFEAIAEDSAGNVASDGQVVEAGFCEPATFFDYTVPSVTLSAAHYFPWHASSPECTASTNTSWCKCVWAPKGALRPARGFYNSASQSVTNAQLDQMIAHGVDVVSVEWNGQTYTTNNIVNYVVPGLASRNLKFVLLYDAAIRLGSSGGTGPIDLTNPPTYNNFVNDFSFFANSNSYFQNANYLKFENKPVVYIYITRAFLGDTPARLNAIQSAFDTIRQATGAYIVADHIFWRYNNTNLANNQDYPKLQRMGASAVTSLAPVNLQQGVSQTTSTRPVRTWANKMAALYDNAANDVLGLMAQGLPLTNLDPGVFVQYNDIGLETAFCGSRSPVFKFNLLDGTDWTYMAQNAGMSRRYIAERTVIKANCSEIVTTNSSAYTSIVWTYSYNEWAEGSGMEELSPNTTTWPYGFGLQVLQRLQNILP